MFTVAFENSYQDQSHMLLGTRNTNIVRGHQMKISCSAYYVSL